ncbi:unnamed protein product [Lactuca saligna]|uniref:Uncharacterized protein n=1 Tax=Lactuca saligna TaxID=75948 RepID=A0AA36ELJ7_LACSI|nr:unnamed protein product [Lactuca saligna]
MLTNKSRKMLKDAFRRLITSQSQKEAYSDPKIVRPEPGEKIARQGNVYSREGAQVQPAICGHAMPRGRMIRDSNRLLTSLEDEQNPFGMKKLVTDNNTDSNRASISLAYKIHCREEPSGVSDAKNKTPNNHAKHKINWHVQKRASDILTQSRGDTPQGHNTYWAKEQRKCEHQQSMEDEIHLFHTQ